MCKASSWIVSLSVYIFGIHLRGVFLQAGNPLSILLFSPFGVRGDSLLRPHGNADSHRCSWTYSNMQPRCQERGEEKPSEREKTMSLMQICHQLAADQKSSIGRRSTESTGASSLCQAPASLRQMSTEGPGSRRGVCVCLHSLCVNMCVYFMGRRGVGTHTMSQGKDLAL